MNTKSERPILIIDGLNCFIRHYLVNSSISSKSEPVGGVVGFLKFIDYITDMYMPQKVFVAWETGGGSARRRGIYKEYKKDRNKIKEMKKIQAGTASMRDQLVLDEQAKVFQLTLLHSLLKKTPICQVFISGAEADDIVAFIATQSFKNSKAQKIIVSGDRDYYQLLENDLISIYDPGKKIFVSNKDVLNEFGISSRNFCLARAIVGDESDNIPGVPGVGLKTIAKRFPMMADLEKDYFISDIIEECNKQIAAKAKQKVYYEIKANEEIIRRNWKLMHLDSSMLSATEINKINYIIENHEPKMDKLRLMKEVVSAGISITFDFDHFTSRLRNIMTL